MIEASFSGVGSVITLGQSVIYELIGAPQPDGVTQKSLPIQLPRNAVVDKYQVVITAAQAQAVAAGDAGQVRKTAGSGGATVVLDFGTPRTVSAVQAPANTLIYSVSPWGGTQFGNAVFSSESGQNYASLASEVRTEKLQLAVSGNPDTQSLASGTVLVMPDFPAGIEVRIDNGNPVFAQASAVAPGSGNWSADSKLVLDLAPALSALTGNSLDSSSATFTATLTSRVPGKLDLQLQPGGQIVRYVRRATFNGQPSLDLSFDAEGLQKLRLDNLPAGLTVQTVRLTATGTPPPVRVTPPVGPDAPDPPLAALTLTADRAACIALRLDSRQADLSGVRVPLAGGDAGGEARMQLWRSKDLTDISPAQPIDNSTSDPVTLDPGGEAWRSFTWKKPLTIPTDAELWAVVIVTRGQLTMELADAGSGAGAEQLLWGAPSGPFHDLPEYLANVRGRIRGSGKPKPDAVFAPVQIQISGGTVVADVTPNPRGTATVLNEAGALQTDKPTLVVTSYAQSTITLRDIDVISTT